jgi:hypothetical protein
MAMCFRKGQRKSTICRELSIVHRLVRARCFLPHRPSDYVNAASVMKDFDNLASGSTIAWLRLSVLPVIRFPLVELCLRMSYLTTRSAHPTTTLSETGHVMAWGTALQHC